MSSYGVEGISYNWIVDSEAIDLVACSLSWFSNSVDHVFVNLPNKTRVQVTHVRTVKITNTLLLTNVLFMPFFTNNLTLAERLTEIGSYCLTFHHDVCLIQDLQSLMMIGRAKKVTGLYHLVLSSSEVHSTVSSRSVFAVQKNNLWHLSHGHLLSKSLRDIAIVTPIVVDDHAFQYDSYHLAKQRKLSFPLSVSTALYNYSLV